jgi:hypothetical protein
MLIDSVSIVPGDLCREGVGADVSIAGESAGKAMTRIYGNIGFKGLWNGLPVRIVMIGTLTVSMLLCLW